MAPERGGRAHIGSVLVGWATTGPVPAQGLRLGTIDARRRSAFLPGRQRAFLAGRTLLGALLTEQFGPAGLIDTAPCAFCGGDHGAVSVSGVPAIASLAYTDDLAVAAVAPSADIARLGVDAETASPDPVRDADLSRLLGVPAGAALRRWTIVEAVLKADGTGLRTDPGQVRIAATTAQIDDQPPPYHWAAVGGAPGSLISIAWQPRRP